MTTFYCVDTNREYYVSLARGGNAFDATPDLMLSCAGASALDGFIATSGSDLFPSRIEGSIITTQKWFDNFVSSLRDEAKHANAGESLRLPYPGTTWRWYVEVEESGSGCSCYDFPVEEFSIPQLGFLFRHMWEYRPVEYTEELIKRAGMDPEDCCDPESYDVLCQAAADKLGFKDVYFY